jgi:hypothetical protein
LAFHFWLDPKTKQKGQGSQTNVIRLFPMLKCGRVIFEQSSQLLDLTKALLQFALHFLEAKTLFPQLFHPYNTRSSEYVFALIFFFTVFFNILPDTSDIESQLSNYVLKRPLFL